MRTIIILTAALFLSGCASTAYWVEKRYDPKGGTIAFNTGGMGVSKSASETESAMEKFCSPQEYKILSEGNQTVNHGAMVNSNGYGSAYVTPVNQNQKVINFVCEK